MGRRRLSEHGSGWIEAGAAQRLQNRPEFIAWMPYVRQMQLEQFEVHGMRLERASAVLQLLREYAVEIGEGN